MSEIDKNIIDKLIQEIVKIERRYAYGSQKNKHTQRRADVTKEIELISNKIEKTK